jgi:hypothetical protein
MVNKELRAAYNIYAKENEQEIIFLDNHSYDNSIIGITEDGRLIYDYEKMIEEYMAEEECDELDAIEWLEVNTLRAIPYMGANAPIIMYNNEEIMKRYA